MSAQTVTTAVATQQEVKTPGALVTSHAAEFAKVLPSHIKPTTWVRLAQGALKKGKASDNLPCTLLEEAALTNPGVFLAALLDAARLGLEPGTEQFYLTPRKVKGRWEILGIPGYQGFIELMYRAGAVSSVVAEVVHTGDVFRFQPGRDEWPHHEIDWDADRGKPRLVYAFARMKDGATSRVVVLNRADIDRIKKSLQGADSEHSPWQKHEAAMWLKSAVRQLAKWVPTSAEYMREQLRAIADVQAERTASPTAAPSILDIDEQPDWIEGDVVPPADTQAEPPAPVSPASEPAPVTSAKAPASEPPPADPPADDLGEDSQDPGPAADQQQPDAPTMSDQILAAGQRIGMDHKQLADDFRARTGGKAPKDGTPAELQAFLDHLLKQEPPKPPEVTARQLTRLHTLWSKVAVTDSQAKIDHAGMLIGRTITSTKDLTEAEAKQLIDALDGCAKNPQPEFAYDALLGAADQQSDPS